MGYTALLFCPEEKTARTVTQVLSELEFAVEACIEPFAAVKKLMGQHFDAVVVDCDNEQNATLLFKSARNSTSNQTSLAVAVVEGQAGVAKAFRIGANLVLTKPINIEQAKGTLRVARGLLRKSEPGKVGAAPAAPSSPAKAVAPKPVSEPTRPTEEKPAAVFAPQPAEMPEVKPTPAWPAAAVASTKPAASDDDLLGIEEKPEVKPASVAAANPDGPILPTEIFAARSEAKPIFAGSAAVPTSAAASAPAPARELKEIPSPQKARVSDDDDVLESGSGTAASGVIVGSAPSFTFGGNTVETGSSGGSKKIIIGIAAAVIIATGLYFGWSHLHGSTDQPSNPETPVSAPAPAAQPVKASVPPHATKPSPTPSTSPLTEPTPTKELSRPNGDGEEAAPATEPTKSTSTPAKTEAEDAVEPAPLMVKGGKAPGKHNKAAPDAPPPSVIGMETGEAAPPPNFAATEATFKPTLQTVNVSQGVSQGLLIKKVPPSYPVTALRMRIEGNVDMVATISANGEITHIKVLSGDAQLTKAATDAVKQWKYKPYLLNGEPVEIQTQITVKFKLPN